MFPVDSGEFPFSEELIDNKLIRTFDPDVADEELVWHRDLEDREIIVIQSGEWGYQLDNQLPLPLEDGQVLFIPKMLWHRVIKGNKKLTDFIMLRQNRLSVLPVSLREWDIICNMAQ